MDVEDTAEGETVDGPTLRMKAFSADERRALIAQLQSGVRAPPCPRCRGTCAVLRIRPRSDVAYVRHRIVVRCGTCLRSLGVERQEVEGWDDG